MGTLPTIAGCWLLLLAAGAAHAQSRLPAAIDAATFAARRAHWAWQPLRDDPVPGDPAQPVDAFVDAALAAHGLERSPPAPPHVQLRRLWFDLVGLPPPPANVARFVAAPSDDAWQREVDELLASPQFAERQARHWLDLVRYAETLGHEFDYELPNAWRYRDYVIRAFDQDLPYDQFVREHLAGDLLPEPRRDAAGNDESVQATAAFWFVEQSHAPVDAVQHQADRIDNQIDVLGKAILGLTLGCARCHDHKFDAIYASDYYALYGFVASSRYVQAPLLPCDVDGDDYREAQARQRELAARWADAGVGVDAAWRPFAAAGPAEWAPADGIALRPEDEVVAAADGARGDWFVSNDGFGASPWRGPFCPDPDASEPRLVLLPGSFWLSSAAGARREGLLQTRTFPLTQRYLHLRVAGEHSRILVIVDGLNLVRDPIYGDLRQRVKDPAAHWQTIDVGAFQGRPAYLQCLDQRAHDLGDPDHKDSEYPADAWLAVQSIVLSPHREPPPTSPAPALPATPWAELAAAVDAPRQRLAAACARLPLTPTVPALTDGTGVDQPVSVRGNHRTPGPLAQRRFLTALTGSAPFAIARGSGRLQLADALLAADDPLPARVAVNRIWHHLFGRGLVATVDNFGALGEPPSHPELLDWLARDFVAHGWSHKHVIRRVVTSATYRQDSRERPGAVAADPQNRLVHRQNVRRLEAEALRDSLLAVSGRLDPVRFGPPVPVPLDGQPDARGAPPRSGPIDGDGRRSIYLAVRRNFPSPLLQAFDQPKPFATVGRRDASNVPAQALALANDPFVHAMCERLAQRVLQATATTGDRIALLYALLFARGPTADEARLVGSFLAAAAGGAAGGATGAEAWQDLAHALIDTTEFCYRR